jgi:DNA adenine methylase
MASRGNDRLSVRLTKPLSPLFLDVDDAESTAVVRPRDRRTRIAFGWYGGKFSHLEWLLPLLPKSHHYCEPFSGSAAVLLNREPARVCHSVKTLRRECVWMNY